MWEWLASVGSARVVGGGAQHCNYGHARLRRDEQLICARARAARVFGLLVDQTALPRCRRVAMERAFLSSPAKIRPSPGSAQTAASKPLGGRPARFYSPTCTYALRLHHNPNPGSPSPHARFDARRAARPGKRDAVPSPGLSPRCTSLGKVRAGHAPTNKPNILRHAVR